MPVMLIIDSPCRFISSYKIKKKLYLLLWPRDVNDQVHKRYLILDARAGVLRCAWSVARPAYDRVLYIISLPTWRKLKTLMKFPNGGQYSFLLCRPMDLAFFR